MGGLVWVGSADSAGLKVVFAAPHDLIQRPEDGIVVTFDQPMVALGPATERPQGPLLLDPPVSGSYRWLGVRTLAFYPAQLAPATRYTATVPAGSKAANGSSLAADYQFDFHTAQPEME